MKPGSTPKVPVVFFYEGSRGSTKQERGELALEELLAILEELFRIGVLKRVQVWIRGED